MLLSTVWTVTCRSKNISFFIAVISWSFGVLYGVIFLNVALNLQTNIFIVVFKLEILLLAEFD